MAEDFRLSGNQWGTGLAQCALVAPIVASVPLSIAVLIGDDAPFWHNLPVMLLIGGIDGIIFAGLPGLVLGWAALAMAQRVVRIRGLDRARRRIQVIGASLGAATGGVPATLLYVAAVSSEDDTASLLAPLALLAIGALTGLGVAAYCLRLLRRQCAG